MSRGIGASPREDGSELADQTRESNARPTARVGELSPHGLPRGLTGRHHPHRNQYRDEAEDVEAQNDALQGRQNPSAEGVDRGPDGRDRDGEESAVPLVGGIDVTGRTGRIIKGEKSLDQSSTEEGNTGKGGLPPQDR